MSTLKAYKIAVELDLKLDCAIAHAKGAKQLSNSLEYELVKDLLVLINNIQSYSKAIISNLEDEMENRRIA